MSYEAMANEELAAAIQAGDDSKTLELWEQVRRLAYQRAHRVVYALEDDRIANIDDLMQAAFLALLDAVERFNPEAGYAFSTVYVNCLKTAFAEATGYRTAAGRNDPMRYADSLNRTITNDSDGSQTALLELVPDPLDQYEKADDSAYKEWQREVICGALSRLDARLAETLRLRFWQGKTFKETGAALGVNAERARQMEKQAFRRLRNFRDIRAMRRYVDDRTDYYRGGQNPVEANVIWRETLEKRFQQCSAPKENRHGRGDEESFQQAGG